MKFAEGITMSVIKDGQSVRQTSWAKDRHSLHLMCILPSVLFFLVPVFCSQYFYLGKRYFFCHVKKLNRWTLKFVKYEDYFSRYSLIIM